MTHVTCRLTAKNWDQLRDPIRSAVEYGLPLPLPLPLYRVFFIYFHVGCCRRRLRSQAKVIKRCGQNGHEAIDNATNSGYCEIGYDASMKAAHRRAPTVDYSYQELRDKLAGTGEHQYQGITDYWSEWMPLEMCNMVVYDKSQDKDFATCHIVID